VSRDITVDLNNPRSVLDVTAIGVLNALQGQSWVFTQVVDVEILHAGGNPRYKPMAVKALRNLGYSIAAVKARQESRYRLNAQPTEMDDWRKAILLDSFSAQLSVWRSLNGAVATRPNDPMLVAALSAAETAVIQTGRTRGMTFAEIAVALTPL
jgi:hypothetical protein